MCIRDSSYIKDVGTGRLTIQSATDFLVANAANTQNYIYAQESGYVRLYHSGLTKLETTSSGVEISNTISSTSDLTIDVGGDIILDADGGDIRFKDAGTEIGALENSSSDLQIKASVQDKDIIFRGNDGGSGINALTLDMSNNGRAVFNAGAGFFDHVNFSDNAKAVFGGGDDLQIYHDGSNSFIDELGTGNLYVKSNSILHLMSDDIRLMNAANSETIFKGVVNGAVSLYHDNAVKLETTTNGISVKGTSSNLITTSSTANDRAGAGFTATESATDGDRRATMYLDADNGAFSTGDSGAYFYMEKVGGGGQVNFINQDTSGYNFRTGGSHVRMNIGSTGKTSWSAGGIGNAATQDRDFTFYTEGSTNGVDIRSNDYRNVLIGAGGSSGSAMDAGYIGIYKDGSTKIALNANGESELSGGVVKIGAGNLYLTGSNDRRIKLSDSGIAGVSDSNNTVHIRGDNDFMKLMAAGNGGFIFEENGTEKARIEGSYFLVKAREKYIVDGATYGKVIIRWGASATGDRLSAITADLNSLLGLSTNEYGTWEVSFGGYGGSGTNGCTGSFTMGGYTGHSYSSTNHNSYGAGTINVGYSSSGGASTGAGPLSYHPVQNNGMYIMNGEVWVYNPSAQEIGIMIKNNGSQPMYGTMTVIGTIR